MQEYKGLNATIVTAADDAFAHLLFDLCASLGSWRRYLQVIDIGLGQATLDELARSGIAVIAPPANLFANAKLNQNYLKALYLRPSMPDFIDADIILWIDADCWIQRHDAISTYFDSAIAFPDQFTLCAMLDTDYPRCIDDYQNYLETYREQYAAVFGPKTAESLFGKAVLSAGVFASRRTSPVWSEWRSAVSNAYDSGIAAARADLSHMAEQLSLNVVLHRERRYRVLNAEMNWHCHCANLVREGDVVRIQPSGRIPAIVHLSDIKNPQTAARYKEHRLFYEKLQNSPERAAAVSVEVSRPIMPEAHKPFVRRGESRICVYTCLIGTAEALNEQPVAAASSIPFICFTDNSDLRSETWQLRQVRPLFAMDHARSQRVVKLSPHEYLGDFDSSLYIDNTVLLKQPPEALIAQHYPSSGFGLAEHSYRGTVLDEFLRVSAEGLDDQNRIFEQLNHYTFCCPEVLREKPFWGAILLRNHRNTAVRRMLDLWLAHILRYSRRDQLSVNFAFRVSGLTPDVFRLDNFQSDFHTWPHRNIGGARTRIYQPMADHAPSDARLRSLELALIEERQQANASIRAMEMALVEGKQQADARVVALEMKMKALRSSLSWRLTAPLREIKRTARKLARVLNRYH